MSEKQLNDKATGETGEDLPDPTLVERLRALCPHFFTSAIERHREGGSKVPRKPKHQLWANVTRDLGGGASTFVHLHIDTHLRKFEFRDSSGVHHWPIGEDHLQQAITSGGTYVGIKIGVETFRLKRAELLAAFKYLRALRTKQP